MCSVTVWCTAYWGGGCKRIDPNIQIYFLIACAHEKLRCGRGEGQLWKRSKIAAQERQLSLKTVICARGTSGVT